MVEVDEDAAILGETVSREVWGVDDGEFGLGRVVGREVEQLLLGCDVGVRPLDRQPGPHPGAGVVADVAVDDDHDAPDVGVLLRCQDFVLLAR
jgi:hypothetical protein